MKNGLIFFLFCFCLGSNIMAQSTISGLVRNNEKIIENAVISVLNKSTRQLLGYTFTNNMGMFSLSLKENSDSVILKVSMMSFQTYEKLIINKNQNLNIALIISEFILKETLVKSPPLRKFGDTLHYSVEFFKDASSKVLVDVLKKLPGIEVKPSGQIVYNNLPINKFYIEGLDLLGGRYSLATENMNIDAVRSVEIFENHQPIRLLDSLKFSDEAALNIVLKKKTVRTGTGLIGMGGSPFIGSLKANPMVFNPRIQSLIGLQINNTGQNLGSQLIDHTTNNVQNKSYLQLQNIITPLISEERYFNNRSILGSLNLLLKLKNNYELKLNTEIQAQKLESEGYNNTLFIISENQTIGLNEIIQNKENESHTKISMVVHKNTSKKYFNNTLNFYLNSESGLGLVINNEKLKQNLNIDNLNFQNVFKNFLLVNKKLYNLQLSFGRLRDSEVLNLSPYQVVNTLADKTTQLVMKNKCFLNGEIGTNVKVKNKIIEFSSGFSFSNTNISSKVTYKLDGKTISAGLDFMNNFTNLDNLAFLKSSILFNVRGWKINFISPISIVHVSVNNKLNIKQTNVEKIIFEPKVELNFSINEFFQLKFGLVRDVSFGQGSQLNDAYIIHNYRQIKSYSNAVLESINYKLSGGIYYKNLRNYTFAHLILSHSISRKNLLFTNKINEQGFIEGNALEIYNTSANTINRLYLSKFSKTLKSTFSFSNLLWLGISPTIINQNEINVTSLQNTLKFDINNNFYKWLILDYGFRANIFKSTVFGLKTPKTIIKNIDFALKIIPKKTWYIQTYVESFVNKSTNSRNLFTDFSVRKSFSKSNIDIEFLCKNILNNKIITNSTISNFSVLESGFMLRPRQFLANISFRY